MGCSSRRCDADVYHRAPGRRVGVPDDSGLGIRGRFLPELPVFVHPQRSIPARFLRDSLHEGAARYVDRIRRDAMAGGEEVADWAVGPSRQLSVDGRPAVLVEVPCGDCNSASLYTGRADTLAEITYSVDDREGYQPGIACRLARVAQSFQWP